MNRILTTVASMLILGGVLDNSALAQDSVINLETGNEVQFIDAYWNANRDIAGLDIACQGFSFSDELGVYEEFRGIREFQHAALPLTSPFIARLLEATPPETVDIGSPFRDPNVWTVVDGVYTGPMPINGLIESIQLNGQDAIRVWFSSGVNTGYTECHDQGDRPFTPTGSASEVLPEPVPLETPTVIVKGSQNPPLDEVLINRETGTEVVLQPARWNLYNDFIGRSIRCNRYEWDGSRYGFGFYVEDFIFFPIETTNIDSGFVYQRSAFTNFTVNNINRDWDVQQGEIKFGEITNQIGNISALGTFFIMEQVEIIPATDTSAGEVRSWISSDEYLTCSDGGLVVGIDSNLREIIMGGSQKDLLPIEDVIEVVEQTTVEESEATEADTTADNSEIDTIPVASEETPPVAINDSAPSVATDNCDYSDADDFDGWGFDPVSMTSCPPLANDNSGSNVVATDTDSDGATTDAADELSDDSTGNSNAETTVENENNTDETVVSNTQDGISIGQESSDETASPSSGGGSFWLPILMFAVAFRRSVLVVEDLYVFPK